MSSEPDPRLERTTLSGRLPEQLVPGAPAPIDPKTGMHRDYWILSDAERLKGFIRPVRTGYRHLGLLGPQHPLRDLTAAEHEMYDQFGYVKYEAYPEGSTVLGTYWTEARLARINAGCGNVTTMHIKLAETYARDPKFYGATFCATCRQHYPVAEFVWVDSDERLGS